MLGTTLDHNCIGQPPEAIKNAKGRRHYLLEQPQVQTILMANPKISARHLSEAIMSSFGVHVPRESVCDMLHIHRRVTAQHALQDLDVIGKLCQAFINANPGSQVDLEVDDDGAFRRFYACPSVHDTVISCLLPITFSDGYHIRNKEFKFQLIGTLALINQRTTFIYAVAIVPIKNTEHSALDMVFPTH
jgi:hypothetical protein